MVCITSRVEPQSVLLAPLGGGKPMHKNQAPAKIGDSRELGIVELQQWSGDELGQCNRLHKLLSASSATVYIEQRNRFCRTFATDLSSK